VKKKSCSQPSDPNYVSYEISLIIDRAYCEKDTE